MEEAALFIHQIQSFFLQQKKELILIWFHEEWMESNYIITVILNEDWTYKDKSEIIDEMWMKSIMKRIVFIGDWRIKSAKPPKQ